MCLKKGKLSSIPPKIQNTIESSLLRKLPGKVIHFFGFYHSVRFFYSAVNAPRDTSLSSPHRKHRTFSKLGLGGRPQGDDGGHRALTQALARRGSSHARRSTTSSSPIGPAGTSSSCAGRSFSRTRPAGASSSCVGSRQPLPPRRRATCKLP